MWSETACVKRRQRQAAAETPAPPMPAQEHPGAALSLTMYVDRMNTAPTTPNPLA